MHNLQGVSLVGRDERDRLYTTRTVGRSKPGQATSWNGGILNAVAGRQ